MREPEERKKISLTRSDTQDELDSNSINCKYPIYKDDFVPNEIYPNKSSNQIQIQTQNQIQIQSQNQKQNQSLGRVYYQSPNYMKNKNTVMNFSIGDTNIADDNLYEKKLNAILYKDDYSEVTSRVIAYKLKKQFPVPTLIVLLYFYPVYLLTVKLGMIPQLSFFFLYSIAWTILYKMFHEYSKKKEYESILIQEEDTLVINETGKVIELNDILSVESQRYRNKKGLSDEGNLKIITASGTYFFSFVQNCEEVEKEIKRIVEKSRLINDYFIE